MTWLDLLELVINSGATLANELVPGEAGVTNEVRDYVITALDALQKARESAVTLPEFESLRTQKMW